MNHFITAAPDEHLIRLDVQISGVSFKQLVIRLYRILVQITERQTRLDASEVEGHGELTFILIQPIAVRIGDRVIGNETFLIRPAPWRTIFSQVHQSHQNHHFLQLFIDSSRRSSSSLNAAAELFPHLLLKANVTNDSSWSKYFCATVSSMTIASMRPVFKSWTFLESY